MKYGSKTHVSNVEATMAKCKSRLESDPEHRKAPRWKERIAYYAQLLKELSEGKPRAKAAAPGAAVDVPLGTLKRKGA